MRVYMRMRVYVWESEDWCECVQMCTRVQVCACQLSYYIVLIINVI